MPVRRPRKSYIFRLLSLLSILLVVPHAPAQSLPGFAISGENWTYAHAGQTTVTGILLKPSGSGPFPAVIINHGKGSTLTAFTRSKALEMVSWGFVCIGPRFTHASDDPDFANTALEGSRSENLRRADVCYQVLQSMTSVRQDRICIYGNSMGAFVTIGITGLYPTRFAAAAITAGGIIASGEAATPTVAEATPIRAPFLILHGEVDGTVPPSRSLLLKQTLDAQNVVNSRITWPGVDHDLHQVKSAEVYSLIRNWFTSSPSAAVDWPYYH